MIKNKIRKFQGSRYYRISKNFSIFTIIGIIQSLMQIFLLWLLIDILKYNTLLITSLVVSILYIAKYYTYVVIGLMHDKFIKYNITNLPILLFNILTVWLLVDYLGFYASISAAIVNFVFFILRFTVLSKVGLIKY